MANDEEDFVEGDEDVGEDDEDEEIQEEERPSLAQKLHRLLKRVLLSRYWEYFMCSIILLYCMGIGSTDIRVQWYGETWAQLVDNTAFLVSFSFSLLEAVLKMIAFGLGIRKEKDDGRIKKLKQLTVQQVRLVDDTFNLIDTKGLGTLNLREFRVALRELGREKGLYLFDFQIKKLFEEVESEHGIEVAELRYLYRRALDSIPEPQPYFFSRWNRVDFLTIFVQFLALCFKWTDEDYIREGTDRTLAQEVMVIARILRLVTLVRVVWLISIFRDWISVMPTAWVSLRDMFLVAIFLIVIYGEVGLYLFGLGGRMYGKCVVAPDNPLAASSLTLAALVRNDSASSSRQQPTSGRTRSNSTTGALNQTGTPTTPTVEASTNGFPQQEPLSAEKRDRNSTVGELIQPLRVCSKREGVFTTTYECEPGYSVCACKKSDRPENWERAPTEEEWAAFRSSEAGCLRYQSG
jgi:hypothetical protein